MSQGVQVVLLCEDTQHETFLRRFLTRMNWSMRRVRVLKAPKGRGSGEQFMRARFPDELKEYRRRRALVRQALIVMLDGDREGVQVRLDALAKACADQNVPPREDADRVAVFVPTWNIESWFAYLDGASADESKSDYPRLPRGRDCQRHVNALVAMCNARRLRDPARPHWLLPATITKRA